MVIASRVTVVKQRTKSVGKREVMSHDRFFKQKIYLEYSFNSYMTSFSFTDAHFLLLA